MTVEIDRLFELQKLLVAFSQVERVTHRKHGASYVQENDTEHSYNLAITAWYLASNFPELKLDLLLKYALVHDLVEVYAGDTFAYGSEADLASKAERERVALERLEQEWPDFNDMTTAIHAYETRADREARFIYALDKIMPILLIYLHDGYTWKRENINVKMLYKTKHEKIALSPEILPYFEKLYELLLSRPDLIKVS